MTIARSVAALCALTMIAGAAHAAQFSADVVDLAADGSARDPGEDGKLYVAGARVRIDRADASGTRFLVDADKGTAYAVAPMQRLYMDAKQSSILTELLVPVDPADPCARWTTMAAVAGDADAAGSGRWQCRPAGADAVDGRPAAKVDTVSPRGVKRTVWIDAALAFPVRIAAADGEIIEVRHIEEAAQPAHLFDIAGSFRKYDPAQLIARIKQSDVWVEPVK